MRLSLRDTITLRSDTVLANQCSQNCSQCTTKISDSAITTSTKRGDRFSKRVMKQPWDTPFNGDKIEYVEALSQEVLFLELHSKRGGGYPTGRWYFFNKEPFARGFGTLSGCVMVIIVSELGYWISHYWEVPGIGFGSNINPKIGQSEVWLYPQADEVFDHFILNELRWGTNQDMKGLRTFTTGQFRPFLPQYNPKAFIFRRGSSGRPDGYDPYYLKKTRDIQTEVWKMTGLEATFFNYDTFPNGIPQQIKGYGFMQYDPDAVDGCDVQGAGWRLWMEADPVDMAVWDALPHQRLY